MKPIRHDWRDDPSQLDRGPLPIGWLVALLCGVLFWLCVALWIGA